MVLRKPSLSDDPTKKHNVQQHFAACVNRNGNPDGHCWDDPTELIERALFHNARSQGDWAVSQSKSYGVVVRHIHQLPSMPSIGHRDVIICLIKHFLNQTKGQATVEDAAVYLARSSWDVLLASYRWIGPENYAAMAEDGYF